MDLTQEMSPVTTSPSPDVTSSEIYLHGIPHEAFTSMRAAEGLTWHPYEDNGFWAVTRHADVEEVSRDSERFSSGIGHTNLWDLEADALEARRSLIDTDAPDHTRLRRVVSKAFTPRSIKVWEDNTRAISALALDNFIANDGGDWVHLVAAPIPINVILSIAGVPLKDADWLIEISNYLVEGTSDKPSLPANAYGNTTPLRLLPFNSPASHALFTYGEEIGEKRRQDPQDDLVTRLVSAQIDGGELTDAEYRNFFHLVIFAGNETTRTGITHGAMAFAANPDQWAKLQDDHSLLDSAVEEILRWGTPVLHMRRTATGDTEVAGTKIAKGDKVVMWYCSANRDAEVFNDPFRFDITRDPNPHFGFGGGGSHFCMGAFLARMELKILLEEMLKQDMILTEQSEAVRAPSNFVHGVLSVEFGLA